MIFDFLLGKLFFLFSFLYLLYTDIKMKRVNRNYCMFIISISFGIYLILISLGYLNLIKVFKDLIFTSLFTVFLFLLAYMSKEKIGYGDVFIYIFIALNIGFINSIAVFLLSLVLVIVYTFLILLINILKGKRFVDKELAFIPFNFISILILMFLNIV